MAPSGDSASLESELRHLAQRYVWWHDPDATLREPERLLLQILKLGRPEDYVLARATWGETALKAALRAAPPGALDERSWVFWRRHYGMPPAPLPKREIG